MEMEASSVLASSAWHRAPSRFGQYALTSEFAPGVVVGVSGIGKVAAASLATTMILSYGVDAVVVLGLSGALHPEVDFAERVVVGGAIEHDVDLRPLAPTRGVGDRGGEPVYPADAELSLVLEEIVSSRAWTGDSQRVHRGTIVSGDQIISSTTSKQEIATYFPGSLCVDMETAAVAQVCAWADVPWAALRVVSDHANESVTTRAILEFCAAHASPYFGTVVQELAQYWAKR
jgi:adenosylhomocysteine nucleosidase